MGEYPSLSSKQIEQLLLKHGFKKEKKRGKGSHSVYTKKSKDRFYYVNVPKRNDHVPTTMENIIRSSGLKKNEFYNLKKIKIKNKGGF
ncbi:MAG: type II toxin-antitoxin system HicA family toxin [bacterium]|nr:type II toxin-antitoxin system HicA family toxin [bacterium]